LTRGLQSLAQRWDIKEPGFGYNDLQFSLNWKVDDFIQDKFIKYTLFDGFDCKEGSNDITSNSNDIPNESVWLQTLGLHNNNVTSTNGVKDIFLFLSIQTETISSSPIYSERTSTGGGTLSADVKFCIRFSLWTEDPGVNSNAIEVNFLESLITFTADLTDGFQIDAENGIVVDNKEKNKVTDNVGCEVIAYECDLQNQPLANAGFLR
jgi:hypothetical protein